MIYQELIIIRGIAFEKIKKHLDNIIDFYDH